MSKTVKLSLKPSFNFILIGIVCSEPIYKLSYLINETISIRLKEHETLKIFNSKRNMYQAFQCFDFLSDETKEYYELIHNKGVQGVLIEEHKRVDFFLKIENCLENPSSIIALINNIKNISLAFEIKLDSLKSKNNLIFSTEKN
ncbi:MAG: IPExxxVDY family protein [Salinivirgaceae bacterium]|nr:IPExxxVDY family protein [Salinivirgaceae bacterium]